MPVETEEKAMTVSVTQLERLRSTLKAWKSAESAANEADEDLGKAKSDRDDKRESLKKAVDEIGDDNAEASDEQEHQLSSLSRDWRRADRKFTECDREKRSRADHEKKVGARFLSIATEIAEGQMDLHSKEIDAGDAWKGVPVADTVGDMQAMHFVKSGLHTHGDVCEQHKRLIDLVKSGDIPKESMEFVCQRIAETMHSRGHGARLPEAMRKLVGKALKAVPDVKPKKPDAAVAAESGEKGED